MAIELKNALTEWKKAKPVLLTKTGVSEALRLLPPAGATSADAIEKSRVSLEKVKKVIDVAVGNSHIKAEKKAHACLVDIQTAIKTEQAKLQKAAEAAKAAAAKVAADAKAAAEAKAAGAKAAQEYAAAVKELKQWFGRLVALVTEWHQFTPGKPRTVAPLDRFTVIHQQISNRLLKLQVPANHPHASDLGESRRALSRTIGDMKWTFVTDVKNGFHGDDADETAMRRNQALTAMLAFEALL